MLKNILFVLAVVSIGATCVVRAQESRGGRAENLAAALDKTKYKKKEKRDITIEIYIDIKNTPAVLASPAEYSGRYICETGESRIDITAAGDGSFTATGEDANDLGGNEHGKFTIRDGRIDGAVLTGTRVFDSGQRQPFEAVFVNRTIRNGKNADEIATVNESFGLGYIVTNGDSRNRVFMEKK